MNFDNAVGISYSRRAQMAGDHAPIRYVLDLNIRCTAIGQGPGALHGKIAGQENSAFNSSTFYQDIIINGASFGSGYVSNLQADPEGPDVKTKSYTATITITKGGNLDNIISAITKDASQYIDNISESFSLEKSSHRRIATHSCSIKYNAPGSPDDSVIKGILGDQSKLESLFGVNLASVYIFKNYSYDEESQTYNFEETREWVQNELSDQSDIIIQQGSFQYSNGIITATFSVEVTNVSEESPVESRANAALQKAASYLGTKPDNIFGSYSDFVIGAKDDLKFKISESLVLNRNEAKCTASTTFSNSPDAQSDGLVYWEYSIETQKLADETINSEEGSVIGSGPYISIDEISGSSEKYDNASQFFGSNCDIGAAKSRCGGQGKSISQSISRGYGEGIINYRYSFSDNKSLLYDDNDGGATIERKKILNTNFQEPLFLHSTFLIPELKELLQKQENILPNLKINSVNISTNSACSISDFISNLYKPNENEITESLSIRFSPQKRECTCETRCFEILN